MQEEISCWREGEHEHEGEDIEVERDGGVEAEGLRVDGEFSCCGSGRGCEVV